MRNPQPPRCILCNKIMVIENTRLGIWFCPDHEIRYQEREQQYISNQNCPKCGETLKVASKSLICLNCEPAN